MKPILSSFLKTKRFKMARKYIHGSVLDIGCGMGDILDFLDLESYYMGVDRNSRFIEWLRENRMGYNFFYLDLDNDELNLGKRFDTILMLAIIEHLKNPDLVISQIPTLLNPRGRVVLTTPTQFGDLIHGFGAQIGLFYRSARDEHETIFSYASLKSRLQSQGLRIDHYQKFLFGGNQLFVCSNT